MRIETLVSLFVAANPGGSLDFLGKGKYFVYYGKGRVYDYRSASHYALAERFGLIPERDAITDVACRAMVRRLRAGETVLSASPFTDTLRVLWLDTSCEDVSVEDGGLDEYDRELYAFTLKTPADKVWWDYNVTRWQSS